MLAPTGTFGNAGRNILTAPGFEDIDFAVSKLTTVKERFSLQFRAEAFNLFNHPNFAQPSNNIAGCKLRPNPGNAYRPRRPRQLPPAPAWH